MQISGREGGEEEPNVQEVYDVQIVQINEEKIRWITCLRLEDMELDESMYEKEDEEEV